MIYNFNYIESEHEAICRTRFERRRLYAQEWPHCCPHCEGSGEADYTYARHSARGMGLDCAYCFSEGLCPRCGQHLGVGVCSVCGATGECDCLAKTGLNGKCEVCGKYHFQYVKTRQEAYTNGYIIKGEVDSLKVNDWQLREAFGASDNEEAERWKAARLHNEITPEMMLVRCWLTQPCYAEKIYASWPSKCSNCGWDKLAPVEERAAPRMFCDCIKDAPGQEEEAAPVVPLKEGTKIPATLKRGGGQPVGQLFK